MLGLLERSSQQGRMKEGWTDKQKKAMMKRLWQWPCRRMVCGRCVTVAGGWGSELCFHLNEWWCFQFLHLLQSRVRDRQSY